MDFATLALGILRELLPKSGVAEWSSEDARAAVTLAACEMADAILNYESETMSKEFYINEAAAIEVSGAVGADYAWSMEGVANAAGRVSAVIDLGAAPRPYMYRWRCSVTFQATPTANLELRLRKSESDGTNEDGNVGTADAALATEPTANCRQLGSVKVEAAGTQANIGGGILECHERYLSLIGWNASGAAVNATDTNFVFTLVPIYDQQQA